MLAPPAPHQSGHGHCRAPISHSHASRQSATAGWPQVSDSAFKELRGAGVEPALLPAVGGLVTGLTSLLYPEVLYQGFGHVNAVLDVDGRVYSAWLLSQIVVAKVVATSVCRGSGLVGGLYAPSIFTGELPPSALLSVQAGRLQCAVHFKHAAGRLPALLPPAAAWP